MADDNNELTLYIVNDGFLYRTSRAPIEKTLTQLKAAGRYTIADGLRRYKILAQQGAQRYAREFPDAPRFTLRDREAAAADMLSTFEAEHDLGNMTHHLAGSDEPRKTAAQLDREIRETLSRTSTRRR